MLCNDCVGFEQELAQTFASGFGIMMIRGDVLSQARCTNVCTTFGTARFSEWLRLSGAGVGMFGKMYVKNVFRSINR
jgi:hypothetical protein